MRRFINRKTIKRAICALVMFMIIFTELPVTRAATRYSVGKYTYAVTVREANLRDKAATSGKILTTVKRDAVMSLKSISGDWYKVDVNGQVGYILSSLVGKATQAQVDKANRGNSGTTSPTSKYGTVLSSELNLRKEPSESSEILAKLRRNVKVEILSVRENWHKVKVSGYTGYVMSKYIKVGSSSTPAPEVEYEGKATVTASELNMRASASTDGSIVTKIRRNAVLNVISVGTKWHKVEYNRYIGYVSASLVKLSGVSATPDPDATPLSGYGYIAGDDVNIRKEPKADSLKVYKLNKATKVTLLSQTGDWIYISTKYGKGYVSSAFITDNPTGEVATLAMGSKGQAVAKLQERLKELGYLTGVADGHYGAITRTAVAAFQTEAKLSSDGKAGARTQEALYSSGAPKKSTAVSDDAEFITLKVPSSGPAVEELQERLQELNYLKSEPDGDFGAVTRTAVKEFQDVQGLKETGVADVKTQEKLFSSKAKENPDAPVDAEEEKPSEEEEKPSKGEIVRMDWWTSNIRSMFARGDIVTVKHVSSGISWKERRLGGTNHADCEPLTAEDTAKMKEAIGGTWSWTRHAVVVSIDGYKVAASINGMPHGPESISDNNFNGHHCIHFTNSRTHTGNRWDPDHQAAVERAYRSDK